MTEQSSSPYEMTVDLNVLDHLGINLYSNIAAVLTETVANSWDADATSVDIVVAPDQTSITISDNGIGMTVLEMNTKYLRVGYRRREEGGEEGRRTEKGRAVMGRKGLGKLSLFSIADDVEVHSAKDGEVHGCRMTTSGIRDAATKKIDYKPSPVNPESIEITTGTRIILRQIKRQRLGPGVAALRKRLARRFSVIGDSFAISIDRIPISVEDRGDLAKTQFLWEFEGPTSLGSAADHVQEHETLSSDLEFGDQAVSVAGWIGTARKPKDLDSSEAGNLNGIVVLARGRLFHENVLGVLNDGRLYTKYVTGQIQADFLDANDEPDIATSDRQRVQEDDPRYVALVAFLKTKLDRVEAQWNEWRKKHEVRRAREENPGIDRWIESLNPGIRGNAERLIAKVSSLPVEKDEDRKLLYRHAIFAFQRMQLRGSTETLTEGPVDATKLLQVLADRDSLEASLYRDIVRSRIDGLRAFQSLVDDNAKEQVLQEFLFKSLWLIAPSWERATESELMESRLTEEGVIVEDLTKKEALGRVDIKYRTVSGKHVIVELKKANRLMKLTDLLAQGALYVDKLKKILLAQNESNPNIEVVFVLGRHVDEEATNPARVKDVMNGISPGSCIVHYDTLIRGARESYSEYLDASKMIDAIEEMLDED